MTDEMEVEAGARAIYAHWQFVRPVEHLPASGQPAWVEGGNSIMQDKARDFARAALEAIRALRPAGEPVHDLPLADGKARDGGWTIDPTYLDEVNQRILAETGYDATIEAIEAALLIGNRASPIIDAKVAIQAKDVPDDCDGVEQDAFEEWAKKERFDMEQHPIHWLFLNDKTSAARRGWRAGIVHARKRILALLRATPTAANASEGDGAYVPQVIEFAEGGYAQIVTEDTATIAAEEMTVQVLRRMAEPRDIIGFQWDLPASPTPRSRDVADYVTLLGAEQVSSAGHTMREAAREMQAAANSTEWALEQHRRFMDDWLSRFEAALEKHAPAAKDTQP